jgi:hypothetical protein
MTPDSFDEFIQTETRNARRRWNRKQKDVNKTEEEATFEI